MVGGGYGGVWVGVGLIGYVVRTLSRQHEVARIGPEKPGLGVGLCWVIFL